MTAALTAGLAAPGLYERGLKQRAKREAAIARRKREKEEVERKECPFEPNVKGGASKRRDETREGGNGGGGGGGEEGGGKADASAGHAGGRPAPLALDAPPPTSSPTTS